MKSVKTLSILLLLSYLIFPKSISAESEGLYQGSAKYHELSKQVIGEITSVTTGVIVQRYDETGIRQIITNLKVGTEIYCNDKIDTRYPVPNVNIEDKDKKFTLKSIKTEKSYDFKYPKGLSLHKIQENIYEKKKLSNDRESQDFDCISPEKKDCKDGECNKKKVNATGVIKNTTGRVTIDRGIDIFPAKEGTEILPGDTIIVHENAEANLDLEGNTEQITINEKSKFAIPFEEKKKPGAMYNIFGKIWGVFKNLFQAKDQFELPETSAHGVRG
jgi:hypothetical protein